MKNKIRSNDTAVKAGEILITEEPYAFVLSSKEKGFRCDHCLTKGKVLKCSGCQFAHYCGRVCQKDGWSEHKWECNNLLRISPKVIPDAARLLSKIISRQNRADGYSYRAFYTQKSFRMWKDLMSHYSDLKNDKKRMDHFTSLSMVLYEFMKDTSLPNAVELMGLYGRMVINSFTILDTDMNSIGTGVYLGCSIVDHSCNPNAVATFDGKTISIRATKDMPTFDWNQIRISYIDLMKTPYERQTELLKNYYFLCQCDRCLDEQQINYVYAAKCLNANCDSPVQVPWKEDYPLVRRLEKVTGRQENGVENTIQNGGQIVKQNGNDNDVVRCSDCGTKYPEESVEVFRKAMEFTELHVQNMNAAAVAYVDVCKYCLDRQEGVLHPFNVMYAQTMDHAFDAYIQIQAWDQASKCAEMLLPSFRFYYGDFHPLLGILHLKYGKILLYKMKLQKALQHLQYSEKILKITHGDIHPLYRNELLPLIQQAVMESN